MRLLRKSTTLCFSIILCVTTLKAVLAALLFPHASVLQITVGVGTPVDVPGHRMYTSIGIQFNYDLPNKPDSFYSLKIFPTKSGKRDLTAAEAYKREYNESMEQTRQMWEWHSKYHSDGERLHHPSDYTAGDLYRYFENTLISLGFHETCLLRSVCELARHPFADEEQNLITETLTFLLTPSLHDAFASNELAYREVYSQAELHGFMGEDCKRLYPQCKKDFLSGITKILSE